MNLELTKRPELMNKINIGEKHILTYEDGYSDGYRAGKQDQINERNEKFQTWVIRLFTVAFFGAMGLLASVWLEIVKASAVVLVAGVIFFYVWSNQDAFAMTIGAWFGI